MYSSKQTSLLVKKMNSVNRSNKFPNTIGRIFSELTIEGCTPVFWKSPGFSYLSFDKNDDVDIFIGSCDLDLIHRVFMSNGFKKIVSASWRSIDGVGDYIGYSEDDKYLIHIQVYVAVTLGKPAGDQCRLSNSGLKLSIKHCGLSGFSSYSDAAVLRLCSAALLERYQRRTLQRYLGEVRLYKQKCGLEELVSSWERLFGPRCIDSLLKVAGGDPLSTDYKALKELKMCVANSDNTIFMPSSLTDKFKSLVSGLNRKTMNVPVLPRRIGAGAVVVILGSDGSGKSTLSRNLVNIFNKKLDTRLIYFGTGNGPSAIYRKPFVFGRWVYERIQAVKGSSGSKSEWNKNDVSTTHVNRPVSEPSRKHQSSQLFMDVVKGLWGISVAFERAAKHRKCLKLKRRGFVVITDRFPQVAHPGIHDGPRLSRWLDSQNRYKKWLANWEKSVYTQISTYIVDQVIFLDVDLPTALLRRPEEAEQELNLRIDTIRKIKIASRRNVRIDAALPLYQVQQIAVHSVLDVLDDGAPAL